MSTPAVLPVPETRSASDHPPDPAPGAAPRQSADPLEQRVADLEARLAAARESLTQSERRRDVYRLLVESGATDAQASSALVMERIAGVAEPDLADEVRALKRRKPGLFNRTSPPSSMGGRESDPPPSPAETAATDARSGGRAALLRYMRARRS